MKVISVVKMPGEQSESMRPKCINHPDKECAGFCVGCGKPLCSECAQKHGRPLCDSCFSTVNAGAETAPKAVPTQKSHDARETTGSGRKQDMPAKKATGVARETGSKGTIKKIAEDKRDTGGMTPKLNVEKERGDNKKNKTDNEDVKKKTFSAKSAFRGASARLTGGGSKEIRRIIARIIDFTLVFIISLPFSWLVSVVTVPLFIEVKGMGFSLSFYLCALFTGSLYFVFSHWKYGKTLGKYPFRIKVVSNVTGGRITFFASLWRWTGLLTGIVWTVTGFWFAKNIFRTLELLRGRISIYYALAMAMAAIMIALVFSLGILITFIGKYKRGFHDLLGGTIIIIEDRNERKK